jgi:hypothetical protein
MLSSWLANRMLDAEHAALVRHNDATTRRGREAWLRAAEFAEDVRLWIDRHGTWRGLRRARAVTRDRRRRQGSPRVHTLLTSFGSEA